MAFRTLNHDDTTLFHNRLWKLLEKKNISTAKELATALYEAGLVAVKQNPNDNSDEVNKANAIRSVEKIQAHLNADKADRLQGEYVVLRILRLPADYLFRKTEIVSGNDDAPLL